MAGSGFKKWKLDFDGNDAALVARRSAADPPGFESSSSGRDVATSSGGAIQSHQMLAMKQAALYSRATGHVKNMGMLAFMMWMSGNQLHLFSIMMTASGVYQPLSAIINSGQAFPESESDEGRLNVWLPRALFCLINLGGLAFALWKINGMGLLPTHASDYIQAMTAPRPLQRAYAAASL